MDQAIIIRRCTAADAPALSGLACRTFSDTFTGTCTDADMQDFLSAFYNEAQMRAELGNPDDHIYFAMLDDVPVGYIRFGNNEVPFDHNNDLPALELNRLYVDKAYKGKGIAQLLMDFYEQYAATNGYRLLWLGVWEHNERAQAFYRKYGFSFSGHRHPFPIGSTPQTDEWWVKVV